MGLVILMRASGLNWTDLGLGREHWKSGLGYALAAVAAVGSVIAVGVLLPMTRPMFMNHHYAQLWGFSGAGQFSSSRTRRCSCSASSARAKRSLKASSSSAPWSPRW